jgi:hypothetical protein
MSNAPFPSQRIRTRKLFLRRSERLSPRSRLRHTSLRGRANNALSRMNVQRLLELYDPRRVRSRSNPHDGRKDAAEQCGAQDNHYQGHQPARDGLVERVDSPRHGSAPINKGEESQDHREADQVADGARVDDVVAASAHEPKHGRPPNRSSTLRGGNTAGAEASSGFGL